MRLTIVRHARAGNKRTWTEPDLIRPLEPVGEVRAVALASILAERPVARLVSSPATRCVQTLQPLADLVDLPIEIWDGLGPEAHVSSLTACFGDPSFGDAVLCTHGEVMRPLLRKLDLRRVTRRGDRLDRRRLLTKGSAWRLRISHGRIVELDHLVPGG